MDLKRRELFKKGALAVGGLSMLATGTRAALETCGLTPAQTEGPFYPISDQADKDWDLTMVKGKTNRALGEVIILKGIMQDDECRPVECSNSRKL